MWGASWKRADGQTSVHETHLLRLGRALDGLSGAMRAHHPDLPEYVLCMLARKDDPFFAGRCQARSSGSLRPNIIDVKTAGLIVHGTWRPHSSAKLVKIMLHEVAHLLARVRGIHDIRGVFHTEAFADLAREVGLEVRWHSQPYGWAHTPLGERALARYSPYIEQIDEVLRQLSVEAFEPDRCWWWWRGAVCREEPQLTLVDLRGPRRWWDISDRVFWTMYSAFGCLVVWALWITDFTLVLP